MRLSLTTVYIVASVLTCAACGTVTPKTHEEVEKILNIKTVMPQQKADHRSFAKCVSAGSPQLEKLVLHAWSQNLDIATAWSRLEQSKITTQRMDAKSYPHVSIEAGAGRSPVFLPQPIGLKSADRIGVSVPVSFEVDVWGKFRNATAGAEEVAKSTHAALEILGISIGAEVASAWSALKYERMKIAFFEEQLKFAQGFGKKLSSTNRAIDDLAVARQNEKIVSLKLQIVESKQRMNQNKETLSLLTGTAKGVEVRWLVGALGEPQINDRKVTLADMMSRPDVRRAFHSLAAADYNLASTVRSRFPTLKLSASLDPFTSVLDLTRWGLWKVGVGLAAPLINGDVAFAVKIAEQQTRERLFEFAQTIVTAYSESRLAVANLESEVEKMRLLEEKLSASKVTTVVAQNLFLSGDIDALELLEEVESSQATELQKMDGERRLRAANVGMCRATAGWTPTPSSR